MKTPTKYTPYLLSLSLFLVFITMVVVTKMEGPQTNTSVSYETGARVNQPGPKERTIDKSIEYGNPVFLKEDVKDEIAPGAARLTANNNTAVVAANAKTATKTTVDDEESWMKKQTKIESKNIKGTDRFLVLVDEFTDNLMLLSKQGQYNIRGFHAEMIRFAQEDTRYICLGRFAQERQAAAFAKTVSAQLLVETFVLDKES